MILGFSGLAGSGKSYSMIAKASRWIGKRPIYSNMGLEWAQDFRTIDELLCIHNALVLLDEAGIWCNSRQWQKFGLDAVEWFSQHRKHGCDLMWTAQAAEGVDKTIRQQTATYCFCSRIGQFITQQWFDGPSNKPLNKTWLMMQPRIFELYDTHMMVGKSDGSGFVGTGFAASGNIERWIKDTLSQSLVREDVDELEGVGFARYRRATLLDLVKGRRVLSRFGRERYAEVEVPDGALDSLRSMVPAQDLAV